ncbi:MAG: L-lactate dehydrogenase [Actinomycetia bacterium]|nr:L-lactate dehydrogenase [Actinomycetes bacterium]
MTDAPPPSLPFDLDGFERSAALNLDPATFAYLANGSGSNTTRDANRSAWDAWALRPHVLRDVSRIDTATTVLGAPVDLPVLVAPTAMQRMAWTDGELAMARATAAARTVLVTSMAASYSVEEVAAVAPDGTRWAQLYLLRDAGRTRALAERARDAGYAAIVLTVDGAAVPYGRRRLADGLTLAQPFSFPNMLLPGEPLDTPLTSLVNDFDPATTGADIERLASWSGLPVVVKGVLRGDDALHAVDHGAAAVVVSNHGGRTHDGCVATAVALAEVADAVAGRVEVYVDGGIRAGIDVARALALGARAVLVGRPTLWGLAVDGTPGVVAVLDALREELVRVMAFCGAPTLADLSRDLVEPATREHPRP